MGELGEKLRGERERRGIGIDEIEAETRIRAKFLLALEEERFDVLPGPAYVRAFVRDYAEQLGLDPQELVNELNTRPELVPPDEVVMMPPRQVAALPLFDRRVRIVVWIAAAVVVAVVAAVVVAVLASRGGSPSGAPPNHPAGKTGTGPGSVTTSPPTTGATGVTTTPPPPGPKPLVLAASGGSVWLSVRAGSATGKLLFNNTLAAGGHLRFARKRLWVRVGAPWNLTMSAAGKHLPIPLQTTGDMLVTAAGARVTA
jgi:hypothetical protein